MRLYTRFRNWLAGKKSPPRLGDQNINSTLARDMGVEVTRTRLPSRDEQVKIERLNPPDR